MEGRRLEGLQESNRASESVDFVTVIYEPEVFLLKLQARSFRLFFHPLRVGEIVLIVNDDDPSPTLKSLQDDVLPEYGHFADRVRIIAWNELVQTTMPLNGWRRQQTLKLLVSKRLASHVYVALDGKNHFIKPAGVDAFVGSDGRLSSFRTSQRGSLKQYFINALSYFDLDPELYIDASMPATTPYPLVTTLVRQMISSIEKKEGMRFDDFFHTPHRNVTEFFLYFGYLVSNHSPPDQFYRFGARNAVTLFTRWPDTDEQLTGALRKLSNQGVIMFGLHKNRVANLKEAHSDIICAHWAKIGLFESKREATDYMKDLVQRTTAAGSVVIAGERP